MSSSGTTAGGQLSKSTYDYHGEGYAFGWKAMRRHPGVTPIVGIISAVVVGVTAWCTYALVTKTDVQVTNNHRWESVDLVKPSPQKLITIQQEYRSMPELSQLLKEINEADK